MNEAQGVGFEILGVIRFRYAAKSVSAGVGAFEISRQSVVEPGHVGGALNIRMAAQRIHAAARSSDVAQQKLHHGGRANDLRSEGMLRPAHRVDDGRDFLHVAVFADRSKQVGGLQELVLGDAGNPLDHFRRVARILLLHQLEDAARMLQREVVSDIRRKSWRGVAPPTLPGVGSGGMTQSLRLARRSLLPLHNSTWICRSCPPRRQIRSTSRPPAA